MVSIIGCGALIVGCDSGQNSKSDDTSGEGSVHIVTSSSALTAADIAKLKLTMSSVAVGDTLTSLLAKNGANWEGTVKHIPVSTDWDFRGDAYDASDVAIYGGHVYPVTIEKDRQALVSLNLNPVAAAVPNVNSAPHIVSFTSSATQIEPSGSIMLALTAVDPDNDALSYSWYSANGSFSAASESSTKWFAPAAEGTYEIIGHVSDARGAQTAASLQIVVATSPDEGSAFVTTSINNWPSVTVLRENWNPGDGPLVAGQTVNLTASADDPDGDTVSYAWSTTCTGSFSDATSASPSFSLTAVPASGKCDLTVTVADGRGGENQGVLTVEVGNPTPDVAPVIDSKTQTGDFAADAETIAFDVDAHDPEGAAVTTTWSADVGSLDTATSSGAGNSNVMWHAPAGFTGAAHIVASVSDGGLSQKRTFCVAAAGEPDSNSDGIADVCSETSFAWTGPDYFRGYWQAFDTVAQVSSFELGSDFTGNAFANGGYCGYSWWCGYTLNYQDVLMLVISLRSNGQWVQVWTHQLTGYATYPMANVSASFTTLPNVDAIAFGKYGVNGQDFANSNTWYSMAGTITLR